MLQDSNIKASQLISLMRPLLEGLVRELKRSFDYFASNFKEDSPGVLYLAGGGTQIKNIDWYLHRELSLEVASLPLPPCVSVATVEASQLNRDQEQLISAAGAALGGCRGINLLPAELKSQKIEIIQRIALKDIAIVAAAVFLLLLSFQGFRGYSYKKRLVIARQHLQALGKIKELKQGIDVREALVVRTQKERIPADGALKLVSAIIESNMVLNDLMLDQDSNTLVLKGVIFTGEGQGKTALTDFIKKIKTYPFFKEASLVAYRNTDTGEQFEIKCVLAQ
jgi:hypothetical protein